MNMFFYLVSFCDEIIINWICIDFLTNNYPESQAKFANPFSVWSLQSALAVGKYRSFCQDIPLFF